MSTFYVNGENSDNTGSLTLEVGTAITPYSIVPQVLESPDSFTVSPSLPDGLTGSIDFYQDMYYGLILTGTPTTAVSETEYTITITNLEAQSILFYLTITVIDPDQAYSGPSVSSSSQTLTLSEPMTDITITFSHTDVELGDYTLPNGISIDSGSVVGDTKVFTVSGTRVRPLPSTTFEIEFDDDLAESLTTTVNITLVAPGLILPESIRAVPGEEVTFNVFFAGGTLSVAPEFPDWVEADVSDLEEGILLYTATIPTTFTAGEYAYVVTFTGTETITRTLTLYVTTTEQEKILSGLDALGINSAAALTEIQGTDFTQENVDWPPSAWEGSLTGAEKKAAFALLTDLVFNVYSEVLSFNVPNSRADISDAITAKSYYRVYTPNATSITHNLPGVGFYINPKPEATAKYISIQDGSGAAYK